MRPWCAARIAEPLPRRVGKITLVIRVLSALLLLALAAYAHGADEKPSGAEKAVNSVGRALEGAGKNVGRAVERTGDNIWIKKGPKKAAKKKEKPG
jgi:hypothetical protein